LLYGDNHLKICNRQPNDVLTIIVFTYFRLPKKFDCFKNLKEV